MWLPLLHQTQLKWPALVVRDLCRLTSTVINLIFINTVANIVLPASIQVRNGQEVGFIPAVSAVKRDGGSSDGKSISNH